MFRLLIAAIIAASAAPALADSTDTVLLPIRVNGPVSVEPVEQSPQDDDVVAHDPSDQAYAGSPSAPVVSDNSIVGEEQDAGKTQSDGVELRQDQQPALGSQLRSEVVLPRSEHLPLGQPTQSQTASAASSNSSWYGRGTLVQTLFALAVVVGLIIVLRTIFVRLSGVSGGIRAQLGAAGKAPSGVLLVLGRYPVSRGMSLVLLQLDQRVLLLSQTSAGFHTLSELTDPAEVASILQRTRDESGDSISARFNGLLRKFESDPETIADLNSTAEAAPVRLRRPDDAYRVMADDRPVGYVEPKPTNSFANMTGEDELRSRISRIRELGT